MGNIIRFSDWFPECALAEEAVGGCDWRQISSRSKNNTDETGKVTPLVHASFGIPYVQYALSFKFKRALFTGGPRMLTLKVFEQTYRDESGA